MIVGPRRLRIGLLVAGLIMLLALGLLLRGALAASAREQELRREALAARVFDELETLLAGYVAAQQARPFVEWRREVVGPTGLTRSPLAEPPREPFVLGYFQIEPDGRFASPLWPGPDEPEPAAELAARVELLRELGEPLAGADARLALAEVGVANEPVNLDPPPQQQQRQQALPEDLQIQRALDQQSIVRQRKNAAAQQNSFAPDFESLSNFVGPGNELAAAPGSADALDVRTTGFVGELVGERLRLTRTVEIGGQRWLQAIVLDRPALEAWLAQEVLGSPELAEFVTLDWRPRAGPDPAAGRWTHRFAPPFAALEVSAELGPSRALASTGARLILALGIGLAFAVIVVLIAVDRSLAGLVARAEERERFIAAVTHELRTPLTSIRMYSEMLEHGMVADPDRQRSYHGTIRGEAERLSRLVEQVLALARVEERGAALLGEAERAPVEEVVASVVELLRPQAEARELDVAVRLDPAAAATPLPRDALAQVLTNLLDNAIKFSPVGAGAIELAAARTDGARVELRIRDRGPGVEAELRERMFEPFVRGRREHEQATPGTGIGLAVVAALVRELGGRVRADNSRDGGLEIVVILPAGE